MDNEKEAIDVGREFTSSLSVWRPEMSPKDVIAAIMHALEWYSVKVEGPGEIGLGRCLYELREEADLRLKSL